MRTFSYFIQDDRYSVPTLQFAVVPDEDRALELARRQLMSSPHHLSVEVHENGRPVFREERPAAAPQTQAVSGLATAARHSGGHVLPPAAPAS